MLEDQEVHMDTKTGIFITMNPGYLGRTELPESLKALFRPVVCVVPDMQLICEVMLFSEGFYMAKALAKKVTSLYKLAEQQLSKKHHYDFGLRAVKSVLSMAGELRRKSPSIKEESILVGALEIMNEPKFVSEDTLIFVSLIHDFFPGIESYRIHPQEFKTAVEFVLEDGKYEVITDQVEKILELREMTGMRHATMVVGPSGGGKSVIIDTFVKARSKIGAPTKLTVLNPKAIDIDELYGKLDISSRDWIDGVFSTLFREMNCSITKNEHYYLLFDGDVDTLWIESMNSLMDDNKLLTLPNGERILLQPHCSLLFEVGDLQYASPATVSRCGMVYVDAKVIGYKPYWERWYALKKLETDHVVLQKCFDKYVPHSIEYIMEKMETSNGIGIHTAIPQSEQNMITQLCVMLEPLIKSGISEETVIETYFLMALYWSVGGLLEEEGRIKFDSHIKTLSTFQEHSDSETELTGPGQLPTAYNTLYDYFFNVEERKWKPWKLSVPDYKYDPNKPFKDIFVPTTEMTRMNWLLSIMKEFEKPVVVVGKLGTSKTTIIQQFLQDFNAETDLSFAMNFSSLTSSMDVQYNLEMNVEKRTKDIFGPPIGKTLTIFIDDMNMPQVDRYGTQQPIALLKLFLEHKGMYGRSRMKHWKSFNDCGLIAAMEKAGGGRNEVDKRFTSLLCGFYMPPPSGETILNIYSSILHGHVQSFTAEVKELVPLLTEMTISLQNEIAKVHRPIPSKFHYIFNMRDISRVYNGMCLSKPQNYSTADKFLRLWKNECLRVFYDRLISNEDNIVVMNAIDLLVEENYYEYKDYLSIEPYIFGDYQNVVNKDKPRYYEDLGDYGLTKKIFQQMLTEYNKNYAPMKLVLFDYAVQNIVHIHRVLRINEGHLLLVGLDGTGKQSLARLATYIAGHHFFNLAMNRGYSEKQFREDLKRLYQMIGVEKKETVFIFTESHAVEEGFLDLINNILTIGMVPTLLTEEERDVILNNIADEINSSVPIVTKTIAWQYFIKMCKKYLHLIIVASSETDVLKTWCRNFPGLMSNATIKWFLPWPNEALSRVSLEFLKESDFITDEELHKVVFEMVDIHQSVKKYNKKFEQKYRRKNYVTPKTFIGFIHSYNSLLNNSNNLIISQCERLTKGLKKIQDARGMVSQLKKKLDLQQSSLSDKAISCNKLLDEISNCTATAQQKEAIMISNTNEVEEKSRIINKEKEEAETALARALPALESAQEALKNLSKLHMTEIRSFATPPANVQTVAECIAALFNKEMTWKSAKGLMADPNFLQQLHELKVESISQQQIIVIKKHLKGINTTVEEMMKSSAAGAGLLKFVLAVVQYCAVFSEVKPKRVKVVQLEKDYQKAMKQLNTLKTEINEAQEELIMLNRKYEAAVLEKDHLQAKTTKLEKRLTAADKLITGLGSENRRWRSELEDNKKKLSSLIGDCLLSSAFLSYAGPFTGEFRTAMLYSDWLKKLISHGINVSDNYRVGDLLVNEIEISKWASDGLPPDEFSIQNGILTTRSNYFPLCIDPQQQAVKWIKKKETNNNLKIISFKHQDFIHNLESAIRQGYPVLIQDVEEYIDPILDDVLERNIRVSEGQAFITVGNKEVEYNFNFNMYLITKLANPNFSATIFVRTTVINYAVTMKGLEDQLLSIIVAFEQKELEEQRERLVAETNSNKTTLKELEDQLLRELATSTGNMIDNEDLLENLENTKSKASEVTEKLGLAAQTRVHIEHHRNTYHSGAKVGALYFFVLCNMGTVSRMYQYSLSAYLEIFRQSVQKSMPDIVKEKRLKNIINKLTLNVYNYGCTGILEKHKLLFSFQLATKYSENEGKISEKEFGFFVKGNVSIEEETEPANPYRWLSNESWRDILGLSHTFPKHFRNIHNLIHSNEEQWKEWVNSESPETKAIPNYGSTLTDFQRLMILRCFRVDRVCMGIMSYIAATIGEQYLTTPVITFEKIFEHSSSSCPVLFILSPGEDPSIELSKFAQEIGFDSNKLKFLSLGQGQEKAAMQQLTIALTRGQWLMLQNCNLLTKWLVELEQLLEDLADKAHPNFRLWLTTDPVENFSVSILQQSFKVVTEAPYGIKPNMKKIYQKLTPTDLTNCSHPIFPSLVYVLAFFHSVITDRRKYFNIGWNINYDFNESDFNISRNIIKKCLDKLRWKKDAEIPWKTMKYLIGEVMYGGRVIDEFDRRIVNTYLDEYLGNFIFDSIQPFHFYCDNSVDYYIPPPGERYKYLEYIKSLPSANGPEVLGLHHNAEIRYHVYVARYVWKKLLKLQPQTGDAEMYIRYENQVEKMISDVLQKLPSPFPLSAHKSRIINSPSMAILFQEMDVFNVLLARIVSSLQTLKKALSGEEEMNPELEDIAKSIYNGQIPESWRAFTPQTGKPLGNWISHFLRRYEQYATWAENGEPIVMWLSGLHFPQSYLTALVQMACQKKRWSLDRATIFTTVTEFAFAEQIQEKLPIGCYVSGFYLENATWNIETGCLSQAKRGELSQQLPIIKITPMEVHTIKLQNAFRCPVYITAKRRNAMNEGWVFDAYLTTEEDTSHWILQGVCLLLNDD